MAPRGEAGGGRGSGLTSNGRRYDAEDTPESSFASSARSTDEDPRDPENILPSFFLVEAQPEADSGLPLSPIYQPFSGTNELWLPVGHFTDSRADWALYSLTVQYD